MQIVAGVVAVTPDESGVLLIQRALPPAGKWALPAGFMEMSETTAEGALREAGEESHVVLSDKVKLLCVFNIAKAGQVSRVLFLCVSVFPGFLDDRICPLNADW